MTTDRPVFVPGQTIKKPEPPTGPGPVKSWSISKLMKFEACPYSVYLGDVEKVPDEDKDNTAMNRGTEIHTMAEEFVTGVVNELPPGIKKMGSDLIKLKELYDEGLVTVEEDWGFDHDWLPSDWRSPKTWGRAKLDAFVTHDPTCATVIDHKTGKKFGNEIKHNFQASVYGITAFMRYPELQFIQTEFWYLDKNEKMVGKYTRQQSMILLPRIKERALRMTNCHEFRPKPNASNCRFCSKKHACDFAEK